MHALQHTDALPPLLALARPAAVNNPPQLTLAGPAGAPGSFAAVLLQSERVTPVAIADPALLLSDVDNDVFPGLTVTILGRRDGAAEARHALHRRSCSDEGLTRARCCNADAER